MSAHEQADRRAAAAALDFLREQPPGDGNGFRSWIFTTAVFAEPGGEVGVELLTFHAAKGREWPTVVVAGVETGLFPIGRRRPSTPRRKRLACSTWR